MPTYSERWIRPESRRKQAFVKKLFVLVNDTPFTTITIGVGRDGMPSRGQRLFMRPICESDRAAVAEFLHREAPGCPPPTSGLIGKLVGDLVAVAGTTSGGDEVILEIVVVAAALRRKRIGRVLVDELATRAASPEQRWLVARKEESTLGFLRRVGFRDRGDSIARRIQSGSEKMES
jgi:GNAT superfamily N-acetyltransferase